LRKADDELNSTQYGLREEKLFKKKVHSTSEGPASRMAANGVSEGGMVDIIRALELIHSPTSTNELRKQASAFLESQKQDKSAARNGFLLASQKESPPLVRYFGLSLLEHTLRHTGFTLSSEQLADVRAMILELGESIRPQDPAYIRNKVAQLWAEIAKRSWAVDWLGMDEALVKLWGATLLHKEFVLSVLETLSEDIFYREDTVSSLRGTDLNRALLEIFTPLSVFEEVYPERGRHVELRYGTEGWLARTCDFLESCIQNLQTSKEAKDCALKALATLKSALAWSIPKAIISANAVGTVCRALTCQDNEIRMVRGINVFMLEILC
jgi:exportin-5